MKIRWELQPCFGQRSGVGNYVYELARRMKNSDEIEFYGTVFNFLGKNSTATALAEITMPVHENRMMPYGVYRRIWDIFPFSYDSLFETADITHFFNYIVPPKIKGKVITTIHDMTYLRYPQTMDSKNLRRIKAGIARSMEVSTWILTISEFSKWEIAELTGFPRDRIEVVYYALSLAKKTESFDAIAATYQLRQPYLLYVGTIEPRKNLIRLLRAFEYLKKDMGIPHQLVLAGGRGWKCKDIYKTATKIVGSKDVIFCGYVSSEIRNALYAHADAFIFPSLYEGFGIPPLEAMAFDCPVICSNAASLPEVVGDAAEYADPFNEIELAEKIWKVIHDSVYADMLRERGRERIKLFSWDRSVQKLFELYQSKEVL